MAPDIWKFLAGLGAFLFGMSQLEEALKQLAGRTFKLFLKRHTQNKVKAILSSALVTGILQSSSVVTLIALGFVGAGILNMRSAFAIVLGSNLGTTLDSWVVATLGFKFDAEKLSFPLIAGSALGLLAFRNREKIQLISRLLMGIGLLFLGLGFMKDSFESLAKTFNLTKYADLNNLSFVLIGLVVTALIQSSSATMIIVLSALNAGTIPFLSAAAVIVGAELGASLKTMLGAIGPVAEKKKVAFGNVFFNLTMTTLAFCFLVPLITLIRDVMGVKDPLIGLVIFQSFINLACIILFYPFLDPIARVTDRIFTRKKRTAVYFILNGHVQEAFVESLEKESRLFIYRVLYLNAAANEIEVSETGLDPETKKIIDEEAAAFKIYQARYANIKQAEGEILSAYTKVIVEKTGKEEFTRLEELMNAVRSAMYSAKGIKDLQQDREDLKNSANDLKFAAYKELRLGLEEFYAQLTELLNMEGKNGTPEKLAALMKGLRKNYDAYLDHIYKKSTDANIPEMDLSTLLNVNRELYSSRKSMIHALKNYLLSPEEAEKFNEEFGGGF